MSQVTVKSDIPQTVNYQTCTVRAGTTTTLNPDDSATVTNSGTEYNAIFNFGIPRGKSAYEQAVEGGYQGTEEEFEQALASDITTVVDNISDINAVGQSIAEVKAVADNLTDVSTVASDISNVNTVAGISSDVSQVAGISSAVQTVSSHNSEVTLVADNMASVMATANSITDVQSVASDITNVNTVAGISSDVSTVATNSAAVNTAATNIAAIIAAPTAAQNAATSATNAQKWAEGTDSDVTPLGGTHSSKGWANVAKQYAESIGTALKYKGSVASYSDLPSTGQEIGDMWNVLDTGKNYAWTGTEWDDLAGVVDLSAYRTAAAQDIIDSGKQATLVSGTNIKTVNSTSLLGSGDIPIDSLPSQTGQSGKFLTTDGTDASWGSVPAGVSADGTTIESNSNVFTTIGVKDQKTSNADKMWTGTKAEYEAIVTKDANTFYHITDEVPSPTLYAKTDLSDITDDGKIVAAKMSMPGTKYVSLTLGADDDEYTAVADGWVFIRMISTGMQYVNIRKFLDNSETVRDQRTSASSGHSLSPWMPVRKGEKFSVGYNAPASGLVSFIFVYAVGSESEAN